MKTSCKMLLGGIVLAKPLAFFDVRGKVSTSAVENNAFISSPGENVQTTLFPTTGILPILREARCP